MYYLFIDNYHALLFNISNHVNRATSLEYHSIHCHCTYKLQLYCIVNYIVLLVINPNRYIYDWCLKNKMRMSLMYNQQSKMQSSFKCTITVLWIKSGKIQTNELLVFFFGSTDIIVVVVKSYKILQWNVSIYSLYCL